MMCAINTKVGFTKLIGNLRTELTSRKHHLLNPDFGLFLKAVSNTATVVISTRKLYHLSYVCNLRRCVFGTERHIVSFLALHRGFKNKVVQQLVGSASSMATIHNSQNVCHHQNEDFWIDGSSNLQPYGFICVKASPLQCSQWQLPL